MNTASFIQVPLLDREYSRDGARLDGTTLRLVARLKQSFRVLLFEKLLRVEYKRVAADSLITVQIRDEVPLTELIENVETIGVQ